MGAGAPFWSASLPVPGPRTPSPGRLLSDNRWGKLLVGGRASGVEAQRRLLCKTGLYPERSRAAHRIGTGSGKGSDPYLAPMRPVWFYVLLEWIPGLPRAPEVVACSPQSPRLFPATLLRSLLLMPCPRACWSPCQAACRGRGAGWRWASLLPSSASLPPVPGWSQGALGFPVRHSGDVSEAHVALVLSRLRYT